MKDSSKTKQALIEELASIRQRIRELEQSEAERKKIEEALRESEGRLNALYQESPIPTFTWQKRGDDFFLTDFNRAAGRITDGKAHNFLGKSAEELYQYQPQVLEDMRQCFTERSVIMRDILSKHFAPGKSLSVHYAFIQPDLIIVHTEDQTDHKRMEGKLQANQAQLSNALEIAHLGHWEYDVANDLFTFNDSFYKIFRTTVEKVGGYTMHSSEYAHRFVHPDDIDVVGEENRKAVETTDPRFSRQLDHRILYADGTVGYITVRFFIVKDSDGRTVKTYGVNQDITERKEAEKQLQNTLDSLRKAVNTTIRVMVSTVETRDPYTSGHQSRSADPARAIATEMELPQDKIEGIRMAGSIHDIGKLSVPAEILSKPSKLTKLEFSLIKEHSQKGCEILKNVESPWPLAEMVYQHHERMDGSGYPRNLKGEDILIEARILAVADVVEAMAPHRPYRSGLSIEAALNEIGKNKGIFYDDAVVDACLKLFREKGSHLEEA